jgi:hypothetical protein
MMVRARLSFTDMLALSLSMVAGQAAKKTDAEIKQLLINESIAAYKGSCACPYSKDNAGKNCGARSAYGNPGGASPLCYETDVTQKMIDDFRKKNVGRDGNFDVLPVW